MKPLIHLVFMVYLSYETFAQENVQKQVASSLRECYTYPELSERDQRLPMTMPVLIELIRKIENDPTFNMNMRELSVALIHRFKQDGILKAEGINKPGILPYSTTGFQFYKHSFLLTHFLPGNAINFNNQSLTALERCTLHFMLSNSIETKVRGDEQSVCNAISYYRRVPRQSIYKDTELLDESGSDRRSECPVENGVIFSKWGEITPGSLISGIAAGLTHECVPVDTSNDKTKNNCELDNLWGNTISGDLAEVALAQPTGDMSVGVSGKWNSSTVPKWYFLTSNSKLQLTDAEIRGDFDGLILGSNVKKWTSDVPTLKLSQILDMYYSPMGIEEGKFRACARNNLKLEFGNLQTMRAQTGEFTYVAEPHVVLKVTINNKTHLKTLADKAVMKLDEYYSSKMKPTLSCTATEFVTNNKVASNIIISMDTAFPYKDMESILVYLLNNIDLNVYGSNMTLIESKNGDEIINSTNTVLDFYSKFNKTVYEKFEKGVNLAPVIVKIQALAQSILEKEKSTNVPGGRSLIALIIVSTPLKETDYVTKKITQIRKEIPDLKILILVKGNKESNEFLVEDKTKDLFEISDQNIISSVRRVVERIKDIPRRVTNPACGSTWSQESNNNKYELIQYVEPQGINFYRIHPNYFFNGNDKLVRILTSNSKSITICYSQNEERPEKVTGFNILKDVECEDLTGEKIFKLSDFCSGKETINECSPLYFSVKTTSANTLTSNKCDGKGCRYPNSLKYTISVDGLGCASSSQNVTFNFTTCITLLLITIFVKKSY